MIRAIADLDGQRGIAAKGSIPWSIPLDSQYFRDQTSHGIVLMGRETYEEFAKPLPNRRNVVISRGLQRVRAGFELITDLPTFLKESTEDIWIIGGAGLYESALPYCDELYLTHVTGDYGCNRFFPDYSEAFSLKNQSPVQVQNDYSFTFAVHIKNR